MGFIPNFAVIAIQVNIRPGKGEMPWLIPVKKYFSSDNRLAINTERRPFSGTATDWK
jgi:hypothetical protein